MIKEGDKLVCINNDLPANRLAICSTSPALTIGKIYEVHKTLNTGYTEGGMVRVLDDNGKYTGFLLKRFITLAEYRNEQINSILND